RGAAGLHLARELHLHGIGGDRRDRRARRHGQPVGRGDRGRHHDRRHRDHARARLSQGPVRQRLRTDSIPHAAVRAGNGADHDLAATRVDRDARAVGASEGIPLPGGAKRPGGDRGRARGPRVSAPPKDSAFAAARGNRAAVGPLLKVEHLRMRFGGLLAVHDLSFTAACGDITALIGPNGAGKTTVFNCITGFYKPTEGRIALQFGDAGVWEELGALTDRGTRSVARGGGVLFLLERMPDYLVTQKAKVARTFQNIRLFPGMTALENLLVAQHNALMRASGFTVLGALGLPRYARAERAAIEKARHWL